MKNQNHTNQLKWIIEEGTHKIPSEDFNTMVIEKFLSEREMIILKPDINYSLLLISAAMILLLSGLILNMHTPSMYIIPFISHIDNIVEKLYITLFAVTAFSIFTVLTDVLENRGVLIKVF